MRVINDAIVADADLSQEEMTAVEAEQRVEVARRCERFRSGRAPIPLAGRTAVFVDDCIATGATAKAACHVARARGASRVVLAVPVGGADTIERFTGYADEVVCLQTPEFFFAVGQGYRNFTQTSDDEVVAPLDRAYKGYRQVLVSALDPPVRDEEVEVAAGSVSLAGHLTIPEHPVGIVVFAHGSGSSRHSPRNRYVAEVLNRAALATLLFDLLIPDEKLNRANVFDIDRCGRGAGRGGRSPGRRGCGRLPRGPARSRGRLAGQGCTDLLIVGGRDDVVLEMNRRAHATMPGECELAVVPGATHLFEEPGTLEQVAVLARHWFITQLSPAAARP